MVKIKLLTRGFEWNICILIIIFMIGTFGRAIKSMNKPWTSSKTSMHAIFGRNLIDEVVTHLISLMNYAARMKKQGDHLIINSIEYWFLTITTIVLFQQKFYFCKVISPLDISYAHHSLEQKSNLWNSFKQADGVLQNSDKWGFHSHW